MNTVIFFSNKTSGGRNISSKKKKIFIWKSQPLTRFLIYTFTLSITIIF